LIKISNDSCDHEIKSPYQVNQPESQILVQKKVVPVEIRNGILQKVFGSAPEDPVSKITKVSTIDNTSNGNDKYNR